MSKKVLLVGRGPQWERTKGATGEIWCASTVYPMLRAIGVEPSRIYQLHGKDIFEPWLSEVQDRVVLIQPDPDYPRASVMPVQRLVERHGFKFGSTYAWMVAQAMDEGFDEIVTEGIQLAHQTEYGPQRDSWFYFTGWGEARGVKFDIPRDSWLFLGDQKYGVIQNG